MRTEINSEHWGRCQLADPFFLLRRLLGASSPSQLETNLTNLEKGPLPKELVDALEEAWMTLKESSFAMEETFA